MLKAIPVPATDATLLSTLQAADLPIEDLDQPGRTLFRFDRDGELVGFGGFESYGRDALLRSVVVVPEHQGEGLGTEIAWQLLGLARGKGAERAYLLTTTAGGFFSQLGFAEVSRTSAPESILATHQAATICSTAAMFTRSTAR